MNSRPAALSVLVVILMSVSEVAGRMMFLLYGWVPAAAAFMTFAVTKGSMNELGLRTAPPRYIAVGYLMAWLLALAVYLPAWCTGFAQFTLADAGAGVESLFGPGASPLAAVAGRFAIYGTLGVLFGSVLALGEEIDWRGLLVPELAVLTSFTKTAILTGVIWALWHLPIIVASS